MERRDKNHLQRRMSDTDKESFAKKPQNVPAGVFMAEHKVAEGETLSHIALKYYGSAVKDKWMLIYEANTDVIGDDPGKIRPGMILKVPALPK